MWFTFSSPFPHPPNALPPPLMDLAADISWDCRQFGIYIWGRWGCGGRVNDFLRRCLSHIKEGATDFGSNLSVVFMIIEPKAQNCEQTHVEWQTFENPENRGQELLGVQNAVHIWRVWNIAVLLSWRATFRYRVHVCRCWLLNTQ